MALRYATRVMCHSERASAAREIGQNGASDRGYLRHAHSRLTASGVMSSPRQGLPSRHHRLAGRQRLSTWSILRQRSKPDAVVIPAFGDLDRFGSGCRPYRATAHAATGAKLDPIPVHRAAVLIVCRVPHRLHPRPSAVFRYRHHYDDPPASLVIRVRRSPALPGDRVRPDAS